MNSKTQNFTLVIFGASGNLTRRKLIPALFQLFQKERLPRNFSIVGVARTQMTDEEWAQSLENHVPWYESDARFTEKWTEFAQHLVYFPGDGTRLEVTRRLESFLGFLENEEPTTRIFYLATAPNLYQPILGAITNGVTKLAEVGIPYRIVVEKPFGSDLESAVRLNAALHGIFREDQIFRIDHYLGKETARNLLVMRFANSIFEPIWNRHFIQDVQITANEQTLVGRRAAYFNQSGILRDMFQNHLLQLLTLTAMEPPARMDSESIRDEKVKVLHSIRPFASPYEVETHTLRGQYLQPPFVLGEEEESLEPSTPTFAAVSFHVENWRWKGVPFFVRSGKGMSCRTTQIILRFRQPPQLLFPGNEACKPDVLLIQLQPAEGIQLYFQTKVPDTKMEISQAAMQFRFAQSFGPMPDAYERLLMDVIRADSGLFIRSDEVEAAWKIIDPIQRAWDGPLHEVPLAYPIGSWGPKGAEHWIERQGSSWFNLCPVLHEGRKEEKSGKVTEEMESPQNPKVFPLKEILPFPNAPKSDGIQIAP